MALDASHYTGHDAMVTGGDHSTVFLLYDRRIWHYTVRITTYEFTDGFRLHDKSTGRH